MFGTKFSVSGTHTISIALTGYAPSTQALNSTLLALSYYVIFRSLFCQYIRDYA